MMNIKLSNNEQMKQNIRKTDKSNNMFIQRYVTTEFLEQKNNPTFEDSR